MARFFSNNIDPWHGVAARLLKYFNFTLIAQYLSHAAHSSTSSIQDNKSSEIKGDNNYLPSKHQQTTMTTTTIKQGHLHNNRLKIQTIWLQAVEGMYIFVMVHSYTMYNSYLINTAIYKILVFIYKHRDVKQIHLQIPS